MSDSTPKSEKVAFGIPCFGLTHDESSDPMEIAASLAAADFAGVGPCVLLFRSADAAIHGGKKLGFDVAVEIGNNEFLILILHTQKARGRTHVAVDLVHTDDGQTACHFHSIDEMLAACRPGTR